MLPFRHNVAMAAAWPGLDWENSQKVVWTAAALTGAMLIGALVIFLTDRWRRRPTQERLSANDQMAHFRHLYEKGELSPEEYTRIRGLLTERLKKEMEIAPAPQPESKPPEQPKPNGAASS
jgi:hypothetical protein